ncbi:MAG: mandelate racemase/muconate lactonizing enzyme family protein [Acetobacteraceae bacterium]
MADGEGQARQVRGIEPPRLVAAPAVLREALAADSDPLSACLDPARLRVVADVARLGPARIAEVAAVAAAFGVRLLLCAGDAAPALAAGHDAALLLPPGAPDPVLPAPTPGPPIRAVTLHRITLPLRELYVSTMYVRRAQPRLLVRIALADGTEGWGETGGGEEIARLVAALARTWIGHDPLTERARLRRAFARIGFDNRNGRNGLAAFAALDLAAWDASARLLGVPLAALLGHAAPPPPVPIAAPLPAAVPPAGVEDRASLARHIADAGNAERIADLAAGMAARHGIAAFKWKSAGTDPAWDEAAMTALRRRLGPGARLRHDPNGAFAPDDALALGQRLAPLSPEFLEDPTDGLEAMARLSLHLPMPIATNMAILSPADLAARHRRGAGPQIVLGDIFYWGGIAGLRDMALVARALGLTPALHSFYESAVATAANAHLAAALGLALPHPMDCGTPGLAADVVPEGALRIEGGHLHAPPGPGIGLAPDPALLGALATADPETIA